MPNMVSAQDEPVKLYSHRSGSWTDFNSWTTDPSGINFTNPESLTPDANTCVYIIPGVSITVPDQDNGADVIINCKSITLNGELVLNGKTGHTVSDVIEGNGRIVLQIENYPEVANNKFVEDGGTTVFSGATVSLSSNHRYSNLEINNSEVTFVGNINIDGNLSVVSGGSLFFNSASGSPVNIKGDLQVNNGCSVSVASGSQSSDLYIGGDIRNDGSIEFTSRTVYKNYSDQNGYVNVHFNSTTHNQTVSCNSPITFYAIFMEKGSSDDYTLRFTAYDKQNFHLYGPAATEGVNNIILDGGTLELGSNIVIPFLNEQKFTIPAHSTILVTAGIVNDDANFKSSIFVEGKLQVSYTGQLNALDGNNGITLVKSGILEVDGGNVTAAYIKNDQGADDFGSYYQTGGNVVVDNPSTGKQFFRLSNANSGFLMKGGKLTVNHGGIMIYSSVANCTVEGGEVVLKATNGETTIISSNASFPSLTLSNDNQPMEVRPEPGYALKVSGNLYIGSNCTLIYNDADVCIAGNLIANGVYDCTNNKTYFNGSGNSEISLPNGFEFANLIIDKSSSSAMVTTVNAFNIKVNLTITGGMLVNEEHDISVGSHISISNGGISSTTGYINLLDNNIQHELTSPLFSPCNFGNLRYAGSNNLVLNGPVITQDFEFAAHSQLVELNGNIFEVTGELIGSSNVHFFRNNGDASGGLKLHLTIKKDIVNTFDFHISSNEHQTPVKIVVDGTLIDRDYTGLLLANTVGAKHPNVGTGEGKISMERYWIVNQTGFDEIPGGAVTYTFEDFNNIPEHLVPEGLVPLKGWKRSDVPDYTGNRFTYRYSTENFFSGEFTCATENAFVMNIYRTKPGLSLTNKEKSKAWKDAGTWRKIVNGVVSNKNDGYPDNNDIAYVYINRVNVPSDITVGQIIFVDEDSEGGTYGYSIYDDLERIQVSGKGTKVYAGRVSGEGVINQDIYKDYKDLLPISDMSDFVNEENSWIMYNIYEDIKNFKTYDRVPNFALECANGTARTYSFDGDLRIVNNLNLRGNVKLEFPNSAANLIVGKDVYVGDWLGAKIWFNNTGVSQTMTVGGDIIMTNNGCNPVTDYSKITDKNYRSIEVNTYQNNKNVKLEHRLVVGGNIYLGVHNLKLFEPGNNGNYVGVILEVNGSRDASIIKYDPYMKKDGDQSIELWKIVMNKDADKKFTIDREFALHSATTSNNYSAGVIKPIVMTSGRLLINNNEGDYTISSGDKAFVINPEAVLETRGTSKYVVANDMQLSGTLIVDDGSDWTVEQSLEYTESATCELHIGNATMNIGAQFRPPVAAGGSISLFLNDANSVLNVGTNATIGKNTRGIFELVNMSSLSMAPNSKLIIKNYINGSSVPDIHINPNICNIDPSAEIIVDAGKNPYTTILSKVEIPRLSVINNSHLKMMGDLTVNRLLNIDATSELAAGGFNLYLKGDAECAGTFTPNDNTTYICGTNEQNINGDITFYNLIKNTTNTVNFGGEITINNQADFLKGTFKCDKILALGNVVNNAVYDCTNYNTKTNGFIFGGTTLQILKSDGNGRFCKITIDNSAGVKLPTGNSFSVVKRFQLTKGIFDLGTCTITMDKDAIFIDKDGNSSFSASNMIQVTDAYATGGVCKVFSSTTSFPYLIPIGTTNKYTPVKINATSLNDGAALTVRPVNEMTNCKPGNSVLGYYWTLKAEDVSQFKGNLIFKFSDSEIVSPSMVGVFQNDNTDEFKTFDGDDVWNYNNKELTFQFSSSVSSDGLSGKYMGSASGDITDCVPVYYAEGLEGNDYADWSEKSIWYTLDADGNHQPVTEVPSNSVVHIYKNVTMKNVPATGVTECKVFIEDGAVLDQDLSMHNDFGTVFGTGTLKSKSGDLPAGVYDDFNSEHGGTLHFYGGGSVGTGYSILKQMPVVNNLIIQSDGDGEVKKFPNMDVQILGNFIINGNVNNEANAVISLKGNLNYESGHFTTGNLGQSKFVFNGDDWQNVTGQNFTQTNCIFNMVVDNPKGVRLYNDVFVYSTIEFVQGVINPCGENGLLTLDNSEDNSVIGFGLTSYVDGPFRKRINHGELYTFPVGNTNESNQVKRYGPLTIQNTNTNGSVYWTVQYFYDSPYCWDQYSSDLFSVSTNEFWSIYGDEPGYKAQILTRWDGRSPIKNQQLNVQDLRQVHFNREAGENKDKWVISGSNAVETGEGGYVESDEIMNITSDKAAPDLFSFGFQTTWPYSWGGDNSSDWYDKENWVIGFVPTKRTDIKIGGNPLHWPEISENQDSAICRDLTLCDGGKLSVATGGRLTVFGDVDVSSDSRLTLKAATKAADDNRSIAPTGSLVYNGAFNGKLTFQRFVRCWEYERMCVPVTGYNGDVSNFLYGAFIYKYREDQNLDDTDTYSYKDNESESSNPAILANGWVKLDKPDPTNLTKPYRYLSSPQLKAHALSFTGTPLANAATQSVVVPVHFTANDVLDAEGYKADMLDGWNFIANPYVSAFDANKLEFNNVDAVIYLHNSIDNVPVAYAVGPGVQVGAVTDDNCRYIAAGQSFFVHATKDVLTQGGNVTFPPESRCHGKSYTQIKSGNQDAKPEMEKLVFLTSGKGKQYQSVVYFADGATEGIDSRFDAYMQEANIKNMLSFYSFGSEHKVPLVANGLPFSVKDGGEIRLGYTAVNSGKYTLSVTVNTVKDVIVYLQDTKNGTITPISEGYSCTVDVEAGTNNSRFKLLFKPNHAPEAVVSVADTKAAYDEKFELALGTDLFVDNDPSDYIANVDVTSLDGSALPAWLSYDYQTGTFSGQPVASDEGVYNIAITATDSHGAKSAPLTFAIKIASKSNSQTTPDVNNFDDLNTVEDPVTPIIINPNPARVEPLEPNFLDVTLPEVIDVSDFNVSQTDGQDNVSDPLYDNMLPLVDEPTVDEEEVMYPVLDQDLYDDWDVKVYPVPSHGPVSVEFSALTQESTTVQMTLVTVSGKVLMTKTLNCSSLMLDLTGRSGVYLIRLATPSRTVTKRIIIQ